MAVYFDVICYLSLKSGNTLSPQIKTVKFVMDVSTFCSFENDMQQKAFKDAQQQHGEGEYALIKVVMNRQ